MTAIKPGARLRSAVCTTEVMVVAAPKDAGVELQCGGAPMLPIDAQPPGGEPKPDAAGGTLLGKRYVNEAGSLEVLCTKPGQGSLAADGTPLAVKDAKPLPSSD
jgi:hypothetical protein